METGRVVVTPPRKDDVLKVERLEVKTPSLTTPATLPAPPVAKSFVKIEVSKLIEE